MLCEKPQLTHKRTEREGSVSLILRRDIRQLMRDTEKVQRSLDILEHDYAARGNQCRQNDLTQLIENFEQLECDVSTMLSDCTFLGRQYWKDHNLPLIDRLHLSFATMNTLFNDLKEIRLALSKTNINPSGLQQLVIDWGRLKKSIDQTQRFVQHSQKRRKNHNWLSAVRQRGGGHPGVESVNLLAEEAPSQESAEPFKKATSIRQTPFQVKGKKEIRHQMNERSN
jgi:hypothetical protein